MELLDRIMGRNRGVRNEATTKPRCWMCPHTRDCVVMTWMKRGILNNYKERHAEDQSIRE